MPEAEPRVRLQILLAARPEAAETTTRWLEAHGVTLTARGARTLSAETPPAVFRAIFGEPPATVSGFTTLEEAQPLPIPKALADQVELITPVARQVHMHASTKKK